MKVKRGLPLSQQNIRPRGCGKTPMMGGIYAVSPEGFNGNPIHNFWIDPTWVLPSDFGLSDIGMQVRQRFVNGLAAKDRQGRPIYDIWDHIGSTHYPNATDWFLEVKELGFHQLLSPDMKFDLLTDETLYIATHNRANVAEVWEFYAPENRVKALDYPECPRDIAEHKTGENFFDTCPHIFWESLKGSEIELIDGRHIRRKMPSFSYEGYVIPKTVKESDLHWSEAAFFSFPWGKMAKILVYEDPETNKHERALKNLEALEAKLQNITLIPLN